PKCLINLVFQLIVPAKGGVSPTSMRRRLVLPLPFSPVRRRHSPGLRGKLTSGNGWRSPRTQSGLLTSSTAFPYLLCFSDRCARHFYQRALKTWCVTATP